MIKIGGCYWIPAIVTKFKLVLCYRVPYSCNQVHISACNIRYNLGLFAVYDNL